MEAKGKQGTKKVKVTYSPEFRAGAVALVLDEKKGAGEIAKNLGVSRSALDKWVQLARIERGQGKASDLTREEKQEFVRLRKEVRQLQMERDILKKAAAFFAKEMMP